MYLSIIILLMFVCPIVSIVVEAFFFRGTPGISLLIGKWLVFWAVGIRLFSAGLRQVVTPEFTAEKIFGIEGAQPLVIVQELGFANISLGLLGIVSIFNLIWISPAAIAGGLFHGLAGLRHLTRKKRNFSENWAMLSDLFIHRVAFLFRLGNTSMVFCQ
ncbi:MAG: hypothetical protein KKB20_27715 [Proteobacteria bacterium]|nr:hypothetical protein [Pseudomonadota bacterium]